MQCIVIKAEIKKKALQCNILSMIKINNLIYLKNLSTNVNVLSNYVSCAADCSRPIVLHNSNKIFKCINAGGK